PNDMLDAVNQAKIVITNFHAFKPRERVELSKGGRQLLQGRTGEELQTLETDGQMIQRVMNDLMGMKDILVINDEAHHCYREKPREADCFLKGLAINVGHDGDPRRRCRISNLVLRARSVNTCLRSLARRRPGKTPRKIDTSNPLAWHICARKQSACFCNWPS